MKNPQEAMKLAMRLAMDETQIMLALNTAIMGYEMCGYCEEWEMLMQRLLERAEAKKNRAAFALIAQAFCKMHGMESTPA